MWDGYGDGANWFTDTAASPPGENNVEGTATHDGTSYWFEFRKRLNSGDGYDWSWASGQTITTHEDAPHLMVGFVDVSTERGYAHYITLNLGTPQDPTFSEFDLFFNTGPVRVIYPSSDVLSKPLGCGAASVSDWLASMAVSTKLTNYTEGLDIGDFVNQTSGRPLGLQGTGIVTFGGQFVNPVVKYAESDSTPLADRAPNGFYNGGSIFYFQYSNGTNIPGANLPVSIINHD